MAQDKVTRHGCQLNTPRQVRGSRIGDLRNVDPLHKTTHVDETRRVTRRAFRIQEFGGCMLLVVLGHTVGHVRARERRDHVFGGTQSVLGCLFVFQDTQVGECSS